MKNTYIMTVLILSISMGMRGAELPVQQPHPKLPQSLEWSPETYKRHCAYRDSDASPSPRRLQSSSFMFTKFACQEEWGELLCEAYNKHKSDINRRHVSEKTWESPCKRSHGLFEKLLERLEELGVEKRKRVANTLAAALKNTNPETPRLLSRWLENIMRLESFSPLQVTRTLEDERKVSAAAGVPGDSLFDLPQPAPRVSATMSAAAMSID